MKNKSKSCSNFKRRELSQSEKILINKYNTKIAKEIIGYLLVGICNYI